MTKTSVLLAAAFATALASAASAQGLTSHNPPSERTTQGTGIDPNFHKSAGGIIDANERKSAGAPVLAVKPGNAGDKKARTRHFGDHCPKGGENCNEEN